jgi:hypothetical protein
LQVEHPVWCGYSPAFHFHPTLPGMLDTPLIWHQVIQVCEPREKRLLAPLKMMVIVDRRITPPTVVPERSVPVSGHSAPQCPDVCRAYPAGDSVSTLPRFRIVVVSMKRLQIAIAHIASITIHMIDLNPVIMVEAPLTIPTAPVLLFEELGQS